MKICNICNRISATDEDHTDCIQMRRVRLEDDDDEFRNKISERNSVSGNQQDLGVEIRAVLEHLAREKEAD